LKKEFNFDDPIVQQEELADSDVHRARETVTQPNMDSTMNTMLVGLGDSQVLGDLPMVILETPAENESGDTPQNDRTTRCFAEFGQE
jgi:hypothetical protein